MCCCERGCKAIVIACNSASSAAYELLKEYVRKDAHILNVIDPMVALISRKYAGKNVGLIGTKRTIQSGIYANKIAEGNQNISLQSLATPLLAPMIEEGFFNNQISHEIIAQYLEDPALKNIEALVLACTHYPLIMKEIHSFYGGRVDVLDSAVVVACLSELVLLEAVAGTKTALVFAEKVGQGEIGRKEIIEARMRIESPKSRKRKEISRQYKIHVSDGTQIGALKEWDSGRVSLDVVVSSVADRVALINELKKRFSIGDA
jgi:glutamate racemase